MATVAKVSREAFAKSRTVIALPTSGAVTPHGVTVTFKRVRRGWAFNQAAVWATEAIVALATITVLSIPGTVVFCSNILIYVKWNVVFCELLKTLANTMAVAVAWACGAAATFTVEPWEALALARLAVAFTFTGAFQLLLVVVIILRRSGPCVPGCASAQGAIGTSPCGNGGGSCVFVVRFKTSVANARVLWVCYAAPVPTALIWATSTDKRKCSGNNCDGEQFHC